MPRPCFVGLQRWEGGNDFARIPVNPGEASLGGADPDGTVARAVGRCGQSTKLGDVSPAALMIVQRRRYPAIPYSSRLDSWVD